MKQRRTTIDKSNEMLCLIFSEKIHVKEKEHFRMLSFIILNSRSILAYKLHNFIIIHVPWKPYFEQLGVEMSTIYYRK